MAKQGSQSGSQSSSKFPRTGFEARFQRAGSHARFLSKVPKNRFTKIPKGSHHAMFPRIGVQEQIPKRGYQARVPKQSSQEQICKQGFQAQVSKQNFCCSRQMVNKRVYLGLSQAVCKHHSDKLLLTFSRSCCCWGYSLGLFFHTATKFQWCPNQNSVRGGSWVLNMWVQWWLPHGFTNLSPRDCQDFWMRMFTIITIIFIHIPPSALIILNPRFSQQRDLFGSEIDGSSGNPLQQSKIA